MISKRFKKRVIKAITSRIQTDNLITEYAAIISRNIISLVNLILGSVIAVLIYFGESSDALFIASVLILNISLGIVQEIRAKHMLDRLKALIAKTAQVRSNDGSINTRPIGSLRINDIIVVERGDQIPIDGLVIASTGLEVNEAFLTGESDSIPKKAKTKVKAGSFVVAGRAEIKTTAIGSDTTISAITHEVRRFSWHSTPIQKSLTAIITTLSYVLIILIISLIWRQQSGGFSALATVKQIAALTASIVPEGLLLASTVLFAYGAIRLSRVKILLQRINSLESLARIQTLCLDKTGTLTENDLQLAALEPAPQQTKYSLKKAFLEYLSILNNDDEISQAAIRAFNAIPNCEGEVIQAFNSDRRFGLVTSEVRKIVVGAPDSLASYCQKQTATWLLEHSRIAAEKGHRVLAVTTTKKALQAKLQSQDRLELIGLIHFAQPLKHTARKTLDFFQKRGVDIKIISGDQLATVRAIAEQLQLKQGNYQAISGAELEKLLPAEQIDAIRTITLFARISPQQKSQIIQTLSQSSYTAMVGDGANDALALKSANVGVSMFQAAEMTRSIADIVLLEDDFSDLPNGVKLADAVITNLELIGALFFNKISIGLSLLLVAFLLGVEYPFSPRNITLLNYFLIGLPILLWTLQPLNRRRSPFETGYFRRIAPFCLLNGSIVAVTVAATFWIANFLNINTQMSVFTVSLFLGIGMLLIAPRAFKVRLNQRYIQRIVLAIAIALSLLIIGWMIPPARAFFDIEGFSPSWVLLGVGMATVGWIMQSLVLSPRRRYLQAT
ncbi:HAD-IC family P-type ATPase [Candidatus Saccharibacteria bacterium]|nr:HAD-IC family P-type ATPase [Candidatus Saccharibacteria bacterium]